MISILVIFWHRRLYKIITVINKKLSSKNIGCKVLDLNAGQAEPNQYATMTTNMYHRKVLSLNNDDSKSMSLKFNTLYYRQDLIVYICTSTLLCSFPYLCWIFLEYECEWLFFITHSVFFHSL